jgi:bifunctional DNA-binding transcriptional regulator/antitoxin component of YhaV-PrlF toxin-antitoxin module
MGKKQMSETRVRIDGRGRILIPVVMRKAMSAELGDLLFLRCDKDGLRVQTQMQRIAAAQALVRRYVPKGVSLVDELIAERRAEAKREEAEARADDKRHYRILERGAV